MARPPKLIDEIGPWSEVKLDIIRDYAAAYSRILSAQKGLHHSYIDAFAGTGTHVSKTTRELVPGSPQIALNVSPPFEEYFFVDINSLKVNELQKLKRQRTNVYVYEGDCNEVLISKVFPRVLYKDFRRALCLLDPYGLALQWRVIATAGDMKTVDIFINFPILDMNRNVLLRNPENVAAAQKARMDAFWGDNSWKEVVYTTQNSLFKEEEKEDESNKLISTAFRKRLKDVAGFKHVAEPLPMRNSIGAVVYYLFFASQKLVANEILEQIFSKYRNRGER